MIRNIYIVVLITVTLSGCRYLIARKYNLNREFTFNSRTEYFNHLQKKYSFASSQVLYPDSSSQQAFLFEISQARLMQYYGSFLNDSVELKKSERLSENLSCMGRILNEMELHFDKKNSGDVIANSTFRTKYFRIGADDSRFGFKEDNKLKIFLLYSYAMGSYSDDFYKEISNWVRERKDKVEIFIISMDPIQTLPR
jgi:hypothetical protein